MAVKAKLRQEIQFSRKGITLTGVVVQVNENSVIVDIEMDAAGQLHLENNKTVVNHKNYEILTCTK